MSDNLKIKAAAILLSLLIWLYVNSMEPAGFFWASGSEENLMVVNLPLELENIPQGFTLSYTTETVKIVLNRDDYGIGFVRQSQAYIDLQGLDAGEHWVAVEVEAPAEVELIAVDPRMVKINLIER